MDIFEIIQATVRWALTGSTLSIQLMFLAKCSQGVIAHYRETLPLISSLAISNQPLMAGTGDATRRGILVIARFVELSGFHRV